MRIRTGYLIIAHNNVRRNKDTRELYCKIVKARVCMQSRGVEKRIDSKLVFPAERKKSLQVEIPAQPRYI